MPTLVVPAAPIDPTPACDWRAGPLNEVVTAGLYLYQTGPLDTIWEELFPVLMPDKDHNYRCLQQVFERGPRIIPGLETEYAQRVASHSWTSPPLQKTGAEIGAVLVFLEPVKGREYLIGKIAEPGWSTRDVAIMADSIWPLRSDAARRELMHWLGQPRKPGDDVFRAVFQLVRFSKPEDFEFVRSRVEWIDPGMARRLRLSLLSKNGEIDAVARALGSKEGAEYAAAADALLQWGHIDTVCSRLKIESNAKRANDIAGRYTSFRRGDYFETLPDDVIATIQRAPQAWDCLPSSIKPTAFNAPRDTTKDRAAKWSRQPLGGDARAPTESMLPKASPPSRGVEGKREVMAWTTTSGKRYLLPEDPCYDRIRQFLSTDTVRFFSSAEGAERAGFQRKPIGLVPLGKFADVCSPLYEYASSSACEKVFLDDAGRAGFVPINRFESHLADVKVVGVVRSKTYLTPCDGDYECLIEAEKARSSGCKQLVESTGSVRVFPSESAARAAGYVSLPESLFSESDGNF
jgi:hypothetical protein